MLRDKRRAPRGFSLIELMIVLAIIGLTTALAAPAMRSWAASAQVRTAGSSLATSLRNAQAQAIKSYQPVVFYRTADSTCSLNAEASATGRYWVVQLIQNPLITQPAPTQPLQCGSVTDSTSNITITGPTAVCFGPNGRPLMLNAPVAGTSCNVNPDGNSIYWIDSSVTAPNQKKLSVWVTLGGTVRLCDRERLLSDSEPDGCAAVNKAATQ